MSQDKNEHVWDERIASWVDKNFSMKPSLIRILIDQGFDSFESFVGLHQCMSNINEMFSATLKLGDRLHLSTCLKSFPFGESNSAKPPSTPTTSTASTPTTSTPIAFVTGTPVQPNKRKREVEEEDSQYSPTTTRGTPVVRRTKKNTPKNSNGKRCSNCHAIDTVLHYSDAARTTFRCKPCPGPQCGWKTKHQEFFRLQRETEKKSKEETKRMVKEKQQQLKESLVPKITLTDMQVVVFDFLEQEFQAKVSIFYDCFELTFNILTVSASGEYQNRQPTSSSLCPSLETRARSSSSGNQNSK
jgi:hypothetical protein